MKLEPNRRRPHLKGKRALRWLRLGLTTLGVAATWLGIPHTASAQVDPYQRRIFHAGYTQSLEEHGPLEAYGFYYHNQPNFTRTNLTLRLAVAPVYLDSELAFRQLFGPDTDLALGVAGGGFADSYSEIRDGNYFTSESFVGHAAEINTSIYHVLNPGQRAPLYAIGRTSIHRSIYESDGDTANTFEIPDDRTTFNVRTGLRLGGREPYLTPSLAGELSVWYEGQFRLDNDQYGYDEDRRVNEDVHLFWARALLAYTFEESKNFLELSLTTGTAINADRFGSYRLGGSLPLIAEFPLTLPGYYRQEISADNFAQLSASFVFPFHPNSQWALNTFGAAALVDYVEGLEQSGHFHSGVGSGILYRSSSMAWQFGVSYSYGIRALRNDGHGAHSITAVMQYDLDAESRAGKRPFWSPFMSADTWRSVFDLFDGN